MCSSAGKEISYKYDKDLRKVTNCIVTKSEQSKNPEDCGIAEASVDGQCPGV